MTLKRNLFRFKIEYLKFRKAYSDNFFPLSSPNYSQGSNIKTAPQANLGKAPAKLFILARSWYLQKDVRPGEAAAFSPYQP